MTRGEFLKANAHWLALSIIAAASIGASCYLFKDEQELPTRLKKLRPREVQAKKLPPVDLSAQKEAAKLLKTPGKWSDSYASLLFVSEPYLMEAEGPRRPKEGSLHKHSIHKLPIPNQWFLDHGLALRTPNVSLEDGDGDGFSNEDEWWWGTDPQKDNSHPPYITKLVFTPQKPTHNRFEFVAYEGNPEKPDADPPLKVSIQWVDAPPYKIKCLEAVLTDSAKPNLQTSYKFQIKLEDSSQPETTEVRVNEIIKGTTLKVMSWNPGVGGRPASITLKNLEGDKSLSHQLNVGGDTLSIPLEQKQKRFRMKVGELIPNTKIKLVRFEPRREKVDGIDATKDRSIIYLKEERPDLTRELPAIYNSDKGENIADFVERTIVLRQDPPKPKEPFSVKLAQKVILGSGTDTESYTVESVNDDSVLLSVDSGVNKGKKWKVSEAGGRLLAPDGKEVFGRPEPPLWNPTVSPDVK